MTRCLYEKKLCRYFATDTVKSHFTSLNSRRGTSYLRNQQRRAFAKSAPSRHHRDAALACHLRNQATIESPQQQFCPQIAEETDENSRAEASSSPVSRQPVVCSGSQYQFSKFQEEEDRRDEVDHFTGEPEAPAVNEDANATPMAGCQCEPRRPLIRLLPLIRGNCKVQWCITAGLLRRDGEGGAPAQSEPTQGDCASL